MSRLPLYGPRRSRGSLAVCLAVIAAMTLISCTDEGDAENHHGAVKAVGTEQVFADRSQVDRRDAEA